MVFPAEPMLGSKNSIMALAKQRSTILVGFDVTDAATAPLVYTPHDGGRTKGSSNINDVICKLEPELDV